MRRKEGVKRVCAGETERVQNPECMEARRGRTDGRGQGDTGVGEGWHGAGRVKRRQRNNREGRRRRSKKRVRWAGRVKHTPDKITGSRREKRRNKLETREQDRGGREKRSGHKSRGYRGWREWGAEKTGDKERSLVLIGR